MTKFFQAANFHFHSVRNYEIYSNKQCSSSMFQSYSLFSMFKSSTTPKQRSFRFKLSFSKCDFRNKINYSWKACKILETPVILICMQLSIYAEKID